MTAKTFFSIKTQFENVGDALINREMIRLAAENSEVKLDLSRCDQEFSKQLLQSAPNNVSIIKGGFLGLAKLVILNRIKGHDCYYFLSPGGYFGELSRSELLKKAINLLALLAFFMLGVKICHIGVSYERIGARNVRYLKIRSSLIHSHLTRDIASYELAKSLNIKVDGTIPDLAFNIFTEAHTRIERSDSIVFSFRADQDPDQLESSLRLLDQINAKYSEDIDFIFYAQVERDQATTESLFKHAQQNYARKSTTMTISGDIDRSLDFLRRSKLAISNRLHVLLMAASTGVEINAATYKNFNQKLSGLLSDLGIPSGDLIDMRSPEAKTLMNRFYITDIGIAHRKRLAGEFSKIYGN